jgi:diadenylate cyclase
MPEFVQNYFKRIGQYPWWIVLLELLLIGVVVHLVVEFLRDTRGARLIKGAGLFLVVAYVVILLGGDQLRRVEFLYSRLLLLATFALVVVFQPELRRALIRLGKARFFLRTTGSPLRPTVDAICRCVEYCAKNSIGALIAIERDVGLGGLVETGTILNANLTPELLNTIFWPGSMLHDMGVVVRNGKLSAAAVQFPLAESESGELAPELGSRHRAALGLSQDTDALIVIVSEETGIISVAENGRLVRNLTVEGLESLLMEGLNKPVLSVPGLGSSRRTALEKEADDKESVEEPVEAAKGADDKDSLVEEKDNGFNREVA